MGAKIGSWIGDSSRVLSDLCTGGDRITVTSVPGGRGGIGGGGGLKIKDRIGGGEGKEG